MNVAVAKGTPGARNGRPDDAPKKATSWQVARRLLKQSKGMRVGACMLIAVLAAGVIVPRITGYDPLLSAGIRLQPPSLDHLFGTDHLGRDVFTRTFSAVYVDLGLSILGVSLPLVIGTVLGAAIGTTKKKWLSGAFNVVIDGINAFPTLILLIGLVAMLGPGARSLVIGLAITNWARYARMASTRVSIVKGEDYITVTSVLGYSRPRVLARHVIPNVSSEVLAYALSDVVIVILTVASLSFLGMGVPAPAAEWGAMISDGRLFLRDAWWMTVFPGLALAWTAMSVSLIAARFTGGREQVGL